MSGTVHGDMFPETTLVHHTMDPFCHRPIFHRREDSLSLIMISVEDFQGDVEKPSVFALGGQHARLFHLSLKRFLKKNQKTDDKE